MNFINHPLNDGNLTPFEKDKVKLIDKLTILSQKGDMLICEFENKYKDVDRKQEKIEIEKSINRLNGMPEKARNIMQAMLNKNIEK